MELRRILVDDDHAAVHISGSEVSGGGKYDVVNLFRLEGGNRQSIEMYSCPDGTMAGRWSDK